jgi:hypothetical protein
MRSTRNGVPERMYEFRINSEFILHQERIEETINEDKGRKKRDKRRVKERRDKALYVAPACDVENKWGSLVSKGQMLNQRRMELQHMQVSFPLFDVCEALSLQDYRP